jgi:hypothetical protein
MVFPENGDCEHQNASEYQSNIMTWCMKFSALSAGLMEDEINYTGSIFRVNVLVRLIAAVMLWRKTSVMH